MNPIESQEPYASFLATKTEMTRLTYVGVLSLVRKHLGKEVHQASEKELIGFFLDDRAKGIKVTTQQTRKAALCSFFKHLAITKKRVSNPMLVVCEEIKTTNKDKTVRKALTPAQREQVYNCLIWDGGIHDYQMSLAILFGFKVGLRRFEIAKVRRDDIDFQEEELTVIGKGAKKATVPLSKIMLEKLKDFFALVDKTGIDSPWVFYQSDCHVGPFKGHTDPSKHFSKFTIGYWFKLIGKRAGLGEDVLFSSHDGRRIFCSTLHEKKVDDLTAIKMSRHESVDMFKKYVRIDKDKVKGELNRAIE